MNKAMISKLSSFETFKSGTFQKILTPTQSFIPDYDNSENLHVVIVTKNFQLNAQSKNELFTRHKIYIYTS